MTKAAQRTRMRAWRSALPETLQRDHAHHIAEHLLAQPCLHGPVRLACYHAVHGEASLMPFVEAIWQRHPEITLCLPRVAGRMLEFAAWQPGTPLVQNRWGIAQAPGPAIPVHDLDVVLLPLLAFDPETGHRLGTGGGYYDRSLAATTHKPLRIGVAYDEQALPLQSDPWDLPCHHVITPTKVYHFQ